jgi:hypothetical protein
MTDLVGGITLIVAAVFLALREVLLSPRTKGWPPAPTMVRLSMIALMAALFLQGMMLTGLFFADDGSVVDLFRSPADGQVSLPGAIMCVAILFYSATTCINVARQYYPPEVWRRLERIMTLVECRQALVLIELTRRGVYVMFPGRQNDPEPIQESDIVDIRSRAG